MATADDGAGEVCLGGQGHRGGARFCHGLRAGRPEDTRSRAHRKPRGALSPRWRRRRRDTVRAVMPDGIKDAGNALDYRLTTKGSAACRYRPALRRSVTALAQAIDRHGGLPRERPETTPVPEALRPRPVPRRTPPELRARAGLPRTLARHPRRAGLVLALPAVGDGRARAGGGEHRAPGRRSAFAADHRPDPAWPDHPSGPLSRPPFGDRLTRALLFRFRPRAVDAAGPPTVDRRS